MRDKKSLYYAGGLIAALGFIALVVANWRINDHLDLSKKLLYINENEKKTQGHGANGFDDGRKFQAQQGYLEDLDIFGDGSVFHVLNRTTTREGENRLSNLLANPLRNPQEMEAFQKAVQELQGQIDGRQMLTAVGLMNQHPESSMEGLRTWLETTNYLSGKPWVRIIRWVLPLFSAAAAYYYLDTGRYYALLLGILLAFLLITWFGRYIMGQHELLSNKYRLLRQYAAILETFAQVQPGSSTVLTQIGQVATNAHDEIRRLSRLSQAFDQRLNKLVNVLLNAFFLYDLHLMIALERWKEENKSHLLKWITCVGDIEFFNSLATFAYNNQKYTYPVVLSGVAHIQAKGLAHPLLAAQERVANDFSIGVPSKLQLITGSNMSGKTTFLRTVGVNLILAQLGAPVCAEQFCFAPMGILSSLRINDSLLERTSYFMAELKKLHSIVANLRPDTPHLVLIDEILRGTNSEDKTHGSEKFIAKLLEGNCLTLFATHDLNLSKMQAQFPDQIANYCFESNIEDGVLTFDYLLRPGIAKNKNASFLMASMGII